MECLSRYCSGYIKGIFALCVVFHHLWQNTQIVHNKLVGCVFQNLGYLSVAVFFFFSGYGLAKSYRKKGCDYIEHFIQNRVLPIYCFYVVVTIVSYIWKSYFGCTFSSLSIVKALTFGETIISNGWFLQTIIVFYLIFCLVFGYVRDDIVRLTVMFVCIALYICICVTMKLGSWWYNSVWAFFLGIVFEIYEDRFTKFINDVPRKSFFLILVSFLFFFFMSYGKNFGIGILQFKGSGTIFQMLSAPCFCVLVIIVCEFVLKRAKWLVINDITQFLRQYSFEIYVCHGFFVPLKKWGVINDDWCLVMIVLECTMIASIPMKKIRLTINSVIQD